MLYNYFPLISVPHNEFNSIHCRGLLSPPLSSLASNVTGLGSRSCRSCYYYYHHLSIPGHIARWCPMLSSFTFFHVFKCSGILFCSCVIEFFRGFLHDRSCLCLHRFTRPFRPNSRPIVKSKSLMSLWGRVWRIGRVDAFRPNGHGFDSRFSRQIRTFGKSFTHSCLWRFGLKFRHSIRAVSKAPLSCSGLEEAIKSIETA